MKKSYVLVFIFCVILSISCFRDPGFSTVPTISYKSVEFINTEGKDIAIQVKINFNDGDGDLGLTSTDSNPPFNSDLKRYIFSKDTIFVENNLNYFNFRVEYLFKINDSTYSTCRNLKDTCSQLSEKNINNLQGRFFDLNPDRKTRPISGELTYNIISSLFTTDDFFGNTLKLKIFIQDRKLNKSNVIETDTFKLK